MAFQVRTLPTFSAGIDSPQAYTVGQTVTLPLPEADGGVGTLSYTLTRDDGSPVLPDGLAFDPVARTISGMPRESFGDTGASMRYTATDATGAVRDIRFKLRVAAAPAIGAIAAQNYTVGIDVNLTLPAATGGLGTPTYTLTPFDSIPTNLVFNAAADTRTLTGTPTSKSTAVTLTYTVTDANGITAEQTFTLEVFSAPTFDVSAIPLPDPASAYTYIANQPFTVTLPPAGGGTAPLSYTLTPVSSIPAGLTFTATATASTLAGRPTLATPAAALTYTATDANGAAITAVFSLSGRLTVTSVSATDGIYTDGDSVLITIAFSEAVFVATGSTPQLALTTGNSDGDGTANYTSGSGTAALTFRYDVLPGDDIGDLAYSSTTALDLNGGTILNAGNIAATLTLPAVGDANSLSDSSAVVLDNTAPVFTQDSTADNRVPVSVSAGTGADEHVLQRRCHRQRPPGGYRHHLRRGGGHRCAQLCD